MLSFIKPADPNETSSLVSPSMSSSGHKYTSNTQNSQCIQFKYICFKKTNLCTWKGSLWLILCIDICKMCLIQGWRCFKIIWKTTYVNNWFPSRTFLIHPPAAPILKNQSTWYYVFNSSVVLFFFFLPMIEFWNVLCFLNLEQLVGVFKDPEGLENCSLDLALDQCFQKKTLEENSAMCGQSANIAANLAQANPLKWVWNNLFFYWLI